MKKRIGIVLLFLLALCLISGCKADNSQASDSEATLPATEKVYTLKYVNSENGKIEGELEQTVKHGDSGKEVVAIPDEGFVFVRWSDGKMTAQRSDFYVRNDVNVYPVFVGENQTFEITYVIDHGGFSVSTKTESGVSNQRLTRTAPEAPLGYRFAGWSDGVTDYSREDGIEKDKEILRALYEIVPLDAPIINISTGDGKPITSKEEYKDCVVSVLNTEEEFCVEELDAEIRGRGNSSWTNFPKKSFRIKFREKQSMFGSEYKAKSWTLIANHCDKTLSRNAIAYEFAARLDDIAFSSMRQFVEVFLNGEYLGTYLMCDQMQTGDGRVDIDESMKGDPDVGYLIEIDARAESEGQEGVDYVTLDYSKHYVLKTPDTDDAKYDPDIYLEYIEDYLNKCLDALSEKNWEKICEYIDVESFADVYIVDELILNLDCHSFSFYMYKDKGGKICAGPVWDFDISSGNMNYGFGHKDNCLPDQDLIDNGVMWVARTHTWFRRLLRNPEFVEMVKERLVAYEDIIKDIIALSDPKSESGYYAKFGKAIERNFVRWDIMGKYVWPNPTEVVKITTVEGQFEYLNAWLKDRYDILHAIYVEGKEYGAE